MLIDELYVYSNSFIDSILSLVSNPNSETLQKNEILKQANSGLYFITDEENADKIVEESKIITVPAIVSYGIKNTFVYAGIPEFTRMVDKYGMHKKFIAIKISPSYESLVRYEDSSSDYLYYDQIYVDNQNIEKVYFYLEYKDKSFNYIESKENIEYHLQIPYKDIKKIEKKMASEIKKYYKILKNLNEKVSN